MVAKKINPATIQSLTEALSFAYWYKNDLRAFLITALPDNNLIPQLDWSEGNYKRDAVRQLMRAMASRAEYNEDLLTLALATADIGDPKHLKKLDDNGKQYKAASIAIRDLNEKVASFRASREEEVESERRKQEERARAELRAATSEKLKELLSSFQKMLSHPDPQARGYALEQLLNDLFTLFDIDAKSSFKIRGEQIDGAFTFQSTEYLLESRWRKRRSTLAELDAFDGKIKRKLKGTLGLFISIEGFEPTAIEAHSRKGAVLIGMDGSDLSLILEDRVGLIELLSRKKQHASRTGQILFSANKLL